MHHRHTTLLESGEAYREMHPFTIGQSHLHIFLLNSVHKQLYGGFAAAAAQVRGLTGTQVPVIIPNPSSDIWPLLRGAWEQTRIAPGEWEKLHPKAGTIP